MKNFQLTKQQIIIGSVVLFILILQFGIAPIMQKGEAVKVATKIMKIWTQDDTSAAIDYWEVLEKSPPIYSLDHYQVLKTEHFVQQGHRGAHILVDLTFPPSEKRLLNGEWVFTMRRSSLGWKVSDFTRYDPKRFPFE